MNRSETGELVKATRFYSHSSTALIISFQKVSLVKHSFY